MLVLASASPRRQELLRNAGIRFEVQPAHIAEDPLTGEGAKDCAERLAREKALAVARQRPHDFVLGADTVVVVDGEILGKPSDRKSTRLNSSHANISYAVFCLEKKTELQSRQYLVCRLLLGDKVRPQVSP